MSHPPTATGRKPEGKDESTNLGNAVPVRGSVVDVWFDEDLPPIYSVLRAGGFTKSEIIETGIKVIDVLVPLEKGGSYRRGGRGQAVMLTESATG